LPPDLKETIFQDLNNELLDGISMQVSQSSSFFLTIYCTLNFLKQTNERIQLHTKLDIYFLLLSNYLTYYLQCNGK
jgi:hypothetical protein